MDLFVMAPHLNFVELVVFFEQSGNQIELIK